MSRPIQTTDDDFEAMVKSGLITYMDWKPTQNIMVWEQYLRSMKKVDGIIVRWRCSDKLSQAVLGDIRSYMGQRFAGENYIEGAMLSELSREIFVPMHGEMAARFKQEILESKYKPMQR
jgi:hypothetical protein